MDSLQTKSFIYLRHGYTTDPELLKQLRTPDDPSWKLFYKKYESMIKSVGCAKGLPAADCEDLIQNVMMVCLNRLKFFLYQKDKGHFRSFLTKITENLSFQLLRKKRMPISESPEYDEGIDQKLMREYEDFILSRLLETLQKKVGAETYAVFEMLTLQDYSVDEICRICHKSRGAVYLVRHRCMKILRKLLYSLPELPEFSSGKTGNSSNKVSPS